MLYTTYRHHGPNDTEKTDLTLNEWTSVLKLSTMWCFTRLRRTAIDTMKPMLIYGDPVQCIVLSRKYEVHEWLSPGLHALARRDAPLQFDEVNVLGILTIIRMAEVRESVINGRYGACPRGSFDFSPIIRRVFGDELKEK